MLLTGCERTAWRAFRTDGATGKNSRTWAVSGGQRHSARRVHAVFMPADELHRIIWANYPPTDSAPGTASPTAPGRDGALRMMEGGPGSIECSDLVISQRCSDVCGSGDPHYSRSGDRRYSRAVAIRVCPASWFPALATGENRKDGARVGSRRTGNAPCSPRSRSPSTARATPGSQTGAALTLPSCQAQALSFPGRAVTPEAA